jgi:aspartyl-tRNA(Asn)/glutamyl-tRNA(Gln) amidotransferase subunit B
MSKDNTKYLIEGKTGKWEVVIGLEVHAQVSSNSKLFSGSSTKFGAEPNTQVSLVDSAFPGMLPVINEFCILQAIKTGLGLNLIQFLIEKIIFMLIFLKGIKYLNIKIL